VMFLGLCSPHELYLAKAIVIELGYLGGTALQRTWAFSLHLNCYSGRAWTHLPAAQQGCFDTRVIVKIHRIKFNRWHFIHQANTFFWNIIRLVAYTLWYSNIIMENGQTYKSCTTGCTLQEEIDYSTRRWVLGQNRTINWYP
jgi:hypothetical protein